MKEGLELGFAVWNVGKWPFNTYCRSKVKMMAVSRLLTPPMQLPKSMNLKAKLTSCNANMKVRLV